jgi:hypothetical protein
MRFYEDHVGWLFVGVLMYLCDRARYLVALFALVLWRIIFISLVTYEYTRVLVH